MYSVESLYRYGNARDQDQDPNNRGVRKAVWQDRRKTTTATPYLVVASGVSFQDGSTKDDRDPPRTPTASNSRKSTGRISRLDSGRLRLSCSFRYDQAGQQVRCHECSPNYCSCRHLARRDMKSQNVLPLVCIQHSIFHTVSLSFHPPLVPFRGACCSSLA